MGRLQKKLEDLMSAVSFAEEGEVETAREFLREERRVLLALRRGQVDRKTFLYAVNICKRVNAKLDVLYISPGGVQDPVLERGLADLGEQGIEHRLVRKEGCLKKAIIDYTNTEKGVLFVVTESSDNLEVDCGGGKGLSGAWQKLRCPLVVVSENV